MSAKSQACQTLPSPPQSWKKGWVLSDLRSTLSLHNVYCITTRVVLVDVSCEKANSYSRPDSLNPDSQLLSVALSCSKSLYKVLQWEAFHIFHRQLGRASAVLLCAIQEIFCQASECVPRVHRVAWHHSELLDSAYAHHVRSLINWFMSHIV